METFKIWLIKSGWFATGSYPTYLEAIEAAKKIPENCSIQKYENGRFVFVGGWDHKNNVELVDSPFKEWSRLRGGKCDES